MNLSLKTLAVAGAMLVASATGAFASSYAYFDHDTKLFDKWANVVGYGDGGDQVKVIKCNVDLGFSYDFCKVKYHGWKVYVKESAIEWGYQDPTPYPSNPQVCVWGFYNGVWGYGGGFCVN
jgi:hypothetical protein